MNRLLSLCTSLLVGIVPAFCSTASAQFGQQIGLEISQQPDADGVLQYEVSIIGPFSSGSGFVDVVAPDGTAFGVSSRSVGGLDFQQVEDRFVGDWNLVSNTFGIAAAAFTLDPFGLDDVFSEVPTFVSPLASGPNATVSGTSFLLDWEYPSGFDGFSGGPFGFTGTGSSVETEVVDRTSRIVSLIPRFGPLTTTDILFTVGNSTRFDDFISLGEVSGLNVSARFVTLAQDFSVTVVPVPEPGTGVIFCAAMMLGFMPRNRGRVASS